MSADPLELGPDVDPARWPFCEARARAETARSSHPDGNPMAAAEDPRVRKAYADAYWRQHGGRR